MSELDTFCVFDEYVPSSATVYSSAEHNKRLARSGQIALHAIFDNVGAALTCNIFLEMSADGRTWLQRNSMQEGTGAVSTTGDISLTTAAAGGSYQLFWADACHSGGAVNGGLGGGGSTGNVSYSGSAAAISVVGTPLLPHLRLRIVTNSAGGLHVRIWAVVRA